MKVIKLEVGPLMANCYLAWNEEQGPGDRDQGAETEVDRAPDPGPLTPCLVIDPGAEPETIMAAMEEEKLQPEMILATHCHGDHIAAVNDLLEAFPDAVFAAGEEEADWPGDAIKNLSYGFGMPMRLRNPTRLLTDGENLEVAGLDFKVLSVPGHSPGSVVLYCESGEAVFTGDTLFAQNIGRGDLPGGDGRLLIQGIREKILSLPESTVVWPGHANRTRIGTEKKSNPFAGENASYTF